MHATFHDRRDAGQQLARQMSAYARHPRGIILGITPGGVLVAREVARHLELPLDIIVAKKIFAPENRSAILGVVTEDGKGILDNEAITNLQMPNNWILDKIKLDAAEARHEYTEYRGLKPQPILFGRTVIIIHEGTNSGEAIRAAAISVRSHYPEKIVVAVPIISKTAKEKIQAVSDEVICIATDHDLFTVASYYNKFPSVEKNEIKNAVRQDSIGAKSHR